MMTISDAVVRSAVREAVSSLDKGVAVLWLKVEGDRDDVARRLRPLLSDLAVVVVLRHPFYRDANAVGVDTVSLMEAMRDQFEEFANRRADRGSFAVLLLSRGELEIVQCSSPAQLPAWWPGQNGSEVQITLRDIRSIAGCSLKSEELAIEEISSLLFEIDLQFYRRFCCALSENAHHGLAFWDAALSSRTKCKSRQEFASSWGAALDEVSDARTYRPSLRSGSSVVCGVWSVFIDNPPSKLASFGTKLSEFVDIAQCEGGCLWSELLLPICFRGVGDAELGVRAVTGRCWIVLIGVSCQLITAAAHADQYGRVNADLLRCVSRELRQGLAGIVAAG